jgi:hypothetical protein
MAKLPFEKIFSGSAGSGSGGGIAPPPFNGFLNWDADLNDPTLVSSTPGEPGIWYRVIVAGNTNLDGITDWQVSDIAVFNTATNTWIKIDNSETLPDIVYAEMYFNNNALPTVIGIPGTDSKITGTYIAGELEGFTHSGGTLTYVADIPNREVIVRASIAASLNGTDGVLTPVIYKNGIKVDKMQPNQDLDGISPSFENISVQAILKLNQSDTIDIFVRNSKGDDVTVSSLGCIVSSIGGIKSGTSDDSSGVPVLSIDSTLGSIIATPTIKKAFYIRIGTVVSLTYTLNFATSAGGSNQIFVNLPFTPGFTTVDQAGGNFTINNGPPTGLSNNSKMRGLSAFGSDKMHLEFEAGGATDYELSINALYEVQ